MTATYLHANALVLRDRGLLLRGPSGGGKSALTLDLIAYAQARGDFARLVADDRVGIEAQNGRLIARPHPAIAGALESRGLGLAQIDCEPGCVLSALVDLLAPGDWPARLPDPGAMRQEIAGVVLPRLAACVSAQALAPQIYLFLFGIVTK